MQRIRIEKLSELNWGVIRIAYKSSDILINKWKKICWGIRIKIWKNFPRNFRKTKTCEWKFLGYKIVKMQKNELAKWIS